jgi:hypothetical protein
VAAEPVVVHVHIDSPPDVVFNCFCDPAALVTWMGDRAELAPRPGGTFAVDIDNMAVRGTFKSSSGPLGEYFPGASPAARSRREPATSR